MVILEAMAAGTPIVATAVDGIPEVLRDREEAVLVPKGDAEACANEVSALLTDCNKATALATAAQARVRAQYSAEVMTRNVEEIYLRCLGASPSTATTPATEELSKSL